MPREASPSIPSQLVSRPAESGRSLASVIWHSQPSERSLLRSTVSASHFKKSQLPALQLALAPAKAQAILQPPQCARLESVSVSHPLLSTPSQFEKGATQPSKVHAPAPHCAVPLSNSQTSPHPPQ